VELLSSKQWAADEVMKVELALQETLANAIRHGCKNDASKQVQCCVTFDAAGELVIVVRDPGTGFDVKSVPNPLEGSNVLRPSGRGVFLINQLMDTVEFSDQGRQVLMRKRPDAKVGVRRGRVTMKHYSGPGSARKRSGRSSNAETACRASSISSSPQKERQRSTCSKSASQAPPLLSCVWRLWEPRDCHRSREFVVATL